MLPSNYYAFLTHEEARKWIIKKKAQAAETAHKHDVEELHHARGQGRWGGATVCPRQGAATVLSWSSGEEIPHVQGKRKPSKMVGTERGHQKADTLKPQSQTTSQSDHMDNSLI